MRIAYIEMKRPRSIIRNFTTVLVALVFLLETDSFSTPCAFTCYARSKNPLSMVSTEDATDATNSSNMEMAWRFIKKPLLRLGSKGAAPSHGNSLRELLKTHKVVKVKVNNRRGITLEEAFENLRNLAEASGMIEGIELLRTRPSENLFMCGVKGTLKLIEDGEYPQSSTQHDDAGYS